MKSLHARMRTDRGGQMIVEVAPGIEFGPLAQQCLLHPFERMVDIGFERHRAVFAEFEAAAAQCQFDFRRGLREEDLDAPGSVNDLMRLKQVVAAESTPLTWRKSSTRKRRWTRLRGRQPAAHMLDHAVGGAEEEIALQLHDLDGVTVPRQEFHGGGRAVDRAAMLGAGRCSCAPPAGANN